VETVYRGSKALLQRRSGLFLMTCLSFFVFYVVYGILEGVDGWNIPIGSFRSHGIDFCNPPMLIAYYQEEPLSMSEDIKLNSHRA
jgi:hypothetical protein